MRMGAIRVFAAALLCFALQAAPAAANERIDVAVNQSRVVAVGGAERVAVANPEVADVIVVSAMEMLVVGKQPGVTTLHVWAAGRRSSYDVAVSANDAQIASDIKTILGYADIRVSKVGKNIVLEGSVNDQYQKSRAEKVAGAYGEKVVNLLEITKPIQVKIEARIIEINRSRSKELGIKWGNDVTAPGSFRFGQGITNSTMLDQRLQQNVRQLRRLRQHPGPAEGAGRARCGPHPVAAERHHAERRQGQHPGGRRDPGAGVDR
jgi:pilus assembly protein CpaC